VYTPLCGNIRDIGVLPGISTAAQQGRYYHYRKDILKTMSTSLEVDWEIFAVKIFLAVHGAMKIKRAKKYALCLILHYMSIVILSRLL